MKGTKIDRRTLLKTLTGLPVLGLFSFEFFKKQSLEKEKKNQLVKQLGLTDNDVNIVIKSSNKKNDNQLIRLGIIGFGRRAADISKALGYVHPDKLKKMKEQGTLKNWLQQDSLNIAVTGICDVFDLHAENGLATIKNKVRPGRDDNVNLPVKRYQNYQDMLESKDIDAVIIATPEHQHARMTIDAVRAGKHVYCEKSFTRTEEEVYQVYDTVKNSDIVFQLGHQVPQSATFKKAREIIKKNILGKISLIETTTNRNTARGAWVRHLDKNGNPLPGDEKTIDWKEWLGTRPYVPFSIRRYYDWTLWFDYSTGLLGQLFTHEFDAVNQLLRIGIPHSVMASGGIYNFKDGRDIPDNLQVAFEYPNHDLTLLYSATLASSNYRGRVFMGKDAKMELGQSVKITADANSKRYKAELKNKIIDTKTPMYVFQPGSSNNVDAVTSATSKYYAQRGLINTVVGGKVVDLTHLHIKEWLDCIRNGGEPSANIDRAFEEGITVQMAQISYTQKRMTKWDPLKRRII